MKRELLEILRCPDSGSPLTLTQHEGVGDEVREGWLENEARDRKYPIRNFVPRFVPESTYADNFGMQWNKFRRTQLDSFTGQPISAERFWNATAWSPAELRGQWVLDAGCGAGRFAEAALDAGAKVVAVDYSTSVDACYANLRERGVHVLQADIYHLPLMPGFFPYVYSLGVLQHTPDVHRAFKALPVMVRPAAGKLCVDYYPRVWTALLHPKYALRPLLKRLDKATLFGLLERSVPSMLAVSNILLRVPKVGRLLARMVPVANYRGILPLDDRQLGEWALLDTFDWFSPAYDNPQTPSSVREWLEEAGFLDVEVLKAGHLVGRGRLAGRISV